MRYLRLLAPAEAESDEAEAEKRDGGGFGNARYAPVDGGEDNKRR
jgi:hypothetical protein